MKAPACKVGGCSNSALTVPKELELCLEHFLDDVEERTRNFNRRLGDEGGEAPLQQAALQFAMLTAAKIAAIGIHNPPSEELSRSRLLHAMLLLTDLRERVERQPTG